MDTVTYPHPKVRNELENWVEDKVDISEQPEVARLFDVSAIPVAVALAPDGSVLNRRLNFVEPDEFQSWLREVRSTFPPDSEPAD